MAPIVAICTRPALHEVAALATEDESPGPAPIQEALGTVRDGRSQGCDDRTGTGFIGKRFQAGAAELLTHISTERRIVIVACLCRIGSRIFRQGRVQCQECWRGKGKAWPHGGQGGGEIEISGSATSLERSQFRAAGKDNGSARVRPQRFAGGTGGQVDAAQIERHSSQTADAIDADTNASGACQLDQTGQVVEDPRARFLMDAPDPTPRRFVVEGGGNLVQVPGLSPWPGDDPWVQAEASRLPRQPLPELTVDQDNTPALACGARPTLQAVNLGNIRCCAPRSTQSAASVAATTSLARVPLPLKRATSRPPTNGQAVCGLSHAGR